MMTYIGTVLYGVWTGMRSFMTHKGIPDYQKSARHILKDYVKGKLLFCHAPPLPGVTDSSFNEQSQLSHTVSTECCT